MAFKLLRAVSTGTELADVINETQSAELNMKNEIKHILRARVGADVEVQPVIPGMCPVVVSINGFKNLPSPSSSPWLLSNRLATINELGAADTKNETKPSSDLRRPEIGVPDDGVR
ncbi:hypothetical protein NW766_009211 [Fusarium irregulare]|uniref:Uncharacterized protein n=1 Tax=Fusarium irregulare TaxID=2494466 RepID=A0A9W8PLJ2_9HYPO|nr:hypothetical protein NW766_009211 [Fusarium irregulare]